MREMYIERRKRIMDAIGSGVIILFNAPEQTRSRDTQHRYRHDSNFYYLSGFPEPDSIMLLVAGTNSKTILFCREKNPELELWDGIRTGPKKAAEIHGFDEAYPINQFHKKLPKIIKNKKVFFDMGTHNIWDETIMNAVRAIHAKSKRENDAPDSICDIKDVIYEMRLIKDSHELNIMRRAAEISSNAHKRAMLYARAGLYEYQVEAEILHEFNKHGCQAPAYTSVVASGKNSCILHYIENNDQLKNGELLLIDAGCELESYASDITRTFPIGKHYSPPQKDIYELVLCAQIAAIDCISEGVSYEQPHLTAIRTLSQGFIDLGLCKGSVDSIIENKDYLDFYMHGTGHWLGMDVHDVGAYKIKNKSRKFKNGMVLTVEPGCYIRPKKETPEHFWNIGVRIEDDIVVSPTGPEVITSNTPKTITEIEDMRKIAHEI